MSGGNQPPPAQIQAGPGRTVVHSLDCAEAMRQVPAHTPDASVAITKIFIKACLLAVVYEAEEG
jgi:hypothetical protein